MSTRAEPSLQITLFGYPRASFAGEPLGIKRRKALALLAYLAASGTDHSRESLAALLWPETESARAFSFLRNTLWILNRTPITDWLSVTRHTLGLRHAETLAVDVLSFRRLCAARGPHEQASLSDEDIAAFTQAVLLVREPFLAGFSIDDSPTFDDWVFSEGEALRQEYTRVAHRLATHHEAAQQYDRAIDFAQRIVAAQPLDEEAYRLTMRLHARRGDRTAALAQYATCQRLLNEELGLQPSESTAQLARRIRNGEIHSPSPPSPSPSGTTRGLPTYATPFVGRQAERDTAVRLLVNPECRVLTITGPGGCGKTRFAVEAVCDCAASFPGGVSFVPLAQIASPQYVPIAIADSLGSPSEEAQRTPPDGAARETFPFTEHTLRYLGHRPSLLVLDNAEHFASTLHWMPELLNRVPELKLLVTSRHQLRLSEEWVVALDGLPFPAHSSPEKAEYPAVSLFLQLALRANPEFSPSEDDVAAIGRITRAVEGIPLGIELAAAWVRSLSCGAIADEVERNLDFLATESPYAEKRHRSLRATFIHSWSLLARDTREAFRRLGVFPGSFTQRAATDILAVSLSQTATLVSRSLLRRLDSGRFAMPEVVREYVGERLSALPRERDDILDRFSRYFLATLSDEEPVLKGAGQKHAMQRIHDEMPNIHAAWRRAVLNGDIASLSQASISLFIYYDMGGHLAEARHILRESLSALSPAGKPDEKRLYAFLLGLHAWFDRHNNPAEAAAGILESLRRLDEDPGSNERAFITLLTGFMIQEALPDGHQRIESVVGFYQQAGRTWELAVARELQAYYSAYTDPTSQTALELAEESVRLRTELGDVWGQAMARFALGILSRGMGMMARAQTAIEESLALRRELGQDRMGAIGCLISLGEIAQSTGDSATAHTYFEEALREAEDVKFTLSTAIAHLHLAELTFPSRSSDAAHHAAAALPVFHQYAMHEEAARCEAYLGAP